MSITLIADPMSAIYENKICPDQRFARQGDQEYSVFSLVHEDPAAVEDWVALKRPYFVMMDPESYQELKNNKIRWLFDKENVLKACAVIQPATPEIESATDD